MLALKLILVVLAVVVVDRTSGHGMMIDPPNRSSLWRYGYHTPPNYEDDQMYCGGFGVQYDQNGGRCGECGDNWAEPRPRENENGGKYGLGIVVKTYKSGELINATVKLTTNHWGWFEYRLCKLPSPTALETDECFDEHLLPLEDGTTRYELKSGKTGKYPLMLQLPKGLTCDRCVLQWHYRVANSWGTCEDGHEGMGCGEQEVFRSCTDIAIE